MLNDQKSIGLIKGTLTLFFPLFPNFHKASQPKTGFCIRPWWSETNISYGKDQLDLKKVMQFKKKYVRCLPKTDLRLISISWWCHPGTFVMTEYHFPMFSIQNEKYSTYNFSSKIQQILLKMCTLLEKRLLNLNLDPDFCE